MASAVDLGRATIEASYLAPSGRMLGDKKYIAVSAPGTFTADGRVREPGAGGLQDVNIVEVPTGVTRRSGRGTFTIGGLTTGALRFSKDGYETAELTTSENHGDYDVPMQKIIRLSAGSSVAPMVTPNDTAYVVGPGTTCSPCKRIRLVSTLAGTVDIKLTWDEARSRLSLWAAGQRFSAEETSLEVTATVPVSAGETLLYVGGSVGSYPYSAQHIRFTLSASSVR